MNSEGYHRSPGSHHASYNVSGMGHGRFPQPASYPQNVYRYGSRQCPTYYPPGWCVPPLPEQYVPYGRGLLNPIFARYRDWILRTVDWQLSAAFMELGILHGVAPTGGAYRPPTYMAPHGGFDDGRYSFGAGGYRGEYDTARWTEEERYHAREDDRLRRSHGMPAEDTYYEEYEEEYDTQGWAEHARECGQSCPACIFLAREEYDRARYDIPLRRADPEASDRLHHSHNVYSQEEHDAARYNNATRRHADRVHNDRLRRARDASTAEEYDEAGYEVPPQRAGEEEEGGFRRDVMSLGVGFPPLRGSNRDGTRAPNTSGGQTPPTLGPGTTISYGLRPAGSQAPTVVAARAGQSTRAEAGTQTTPTSSSTDTTASGMSAGRGESGEPPSAPRDS